MVSVDHPERVIRALDRLRPLSRRRRPPHFDVHRLLIAARQEAGLDDFGEPSFREGLDRLVASLDDEADLDRIQRRHWRTELISLLVRRLVLRDLTKAGSGRPRPDAIAPVVVIGADAAVRGALASVAGVDLVGETADGDTDLLCSSFASVRFHGAAGVDRYDSWLLEADLAAAYRLHRIDLEHRSATPSRETLLLTGPDHLWNLDVIHEVYPASTLIVVDDGVPADRSSPWAGDFDTWWGARLLEGTARLARHRQLWPAERVVQSTHQVIVSDPAAALGRIARLAG